MTTYRAGARSSVEELFAKEGDSLERHGHALPNYPDHEQRELFEEHVRRERLQAGVVIEPVSEEV